MPFAEDEEISSIAAANSFAVLSAAGVLGSIALGWTSDALGRKHALALVYGLRVLSFPLLIVVANTGNLVLLYIFALVFGLTFIANMAPTAGIIRGRYGVASTGTIMGWLLLTHQLGGAAGTYLGGLLYSMNGSYALTFVLMTAVALAGTVLSLFIKEQNRCLTS